MEGPIGFLARVVMWIGLAAFACSAQASGADKPPSFEEVQTAAKAGSAEAENDLGNRYLQGAGVAKDEVQAAIWYRKAAEQGYAPAQSALGGLYLHGVGVPPDAMQASDWIRKAAEQGEALAQSDLGMMYLKGIAVPQEDAQAILWLRKAAEQGSPAGQYNLASLYQRGGAGLAEDDAEATRWYGKAAVQAAWQLGVRQSRQKLCEYGGENSVWCAEIDTPGAFGPVEDLVAAAEGGDAKAQSALGDMYQRGLGVQKDVAQSADWYRKAAALGYAPAQAMLGYMYYEGVGVTKDIDVGLSLYCKAAAQGNSRARANLEIMQIYRQFDPKECSVRLAR